MTSGVPDPSAEGRNGTLIIYSYFEDHDPAKPAKQNFEFFVEVGMTPLVNHPHVHFLVIVNGDEFTVKLPEANNIVVHRRARNFGMDVCAYKETFPLVDDGTIKLPGGHKFEKYRYFVIMNASVRGPFMPWGVRVHWLDHFLMQITARDKLVGTSINCLGPRHDPQLPGRTHSQMHLQSMFLVMDYMIFPLIRLHLPCASGWEIPAYEGEVKFTWETLKNGYGIVSQLLLFRGVDFTNVQAANEACQLAIGGDHYFPGNYNGININPLEVIFYKANRGVDDQLLTKYGEWILRAHRAARK